MSKTKVAIVKGTDPKPMVRRALEMIDAAAIISPGDDFLVKPNCVVPKVPSTGITTDSRVVESIVEFLRDNGVQNITIGEGGNRNTDRAFDITGMREVALRHGLRLVNFNNDEGVEVEIPSAKALHRFSISKAVLASASIVNVPKLKIHHMAQVTLSIKNLMGVIVGDRGAIMHRQVDEKLVDLASFVRPRLNVIDGIIGSEMDEVLGEPVPMNLVIAGTDMVATDAIGSAVMGVDPRMVRHLKLAEERGLGVASLDEITVVGEPIEDVRKNFRRGFSKERLKNYGFDHDVGEEVLKPLWEGRGSNLPRTQR
jgi:uncharacterized protein (DUF362 family)